MNQKDLSMLGMFATSERSITDTLAILRKGFDIDVFDQVTANLEISRNELAGMIGANIRTVHQLLEGKPLPTAHSERLLAIITLFSEATQYFGDDAKARQWFKVPSIALDNKSPLSLCDTFLGISVVNNQLNRHIHGMTA